MTDVDLNETLNGYRGAIGKLVFWRFRDRTVVSRKGMISKPPTEAQKAQRSHFREAVTLGKSAMTDPVLNAFYGPLARQKETSIYALAHQDFLKGPTLEPLDLSGYKGQVGDVIEIRASDNVCVADLNVKIVAQDDTPIESGQAVEMGGRSGRWNTLSRSLCPPARRSASRSKRLIALATKLRSQQTLLWVPMPEMQA